MGKKLNVEIKRRTSETNKNECAHFQGSYHEKSFAFLLEKMQKTFD